MSKKIESRTPKRTKTPTKRTAKPAAKPAKMPTADKLLRLKQAEQRAVIAYRDAVYDLHPNLSLAMRLRDHAGKLSLAVREIVSPGPDHAGFTRAARSVGDIARLLEHEAQGVERDVLRSGVQS